MPWSKDIPAIVSQGYAGEQAGMALAEVLFGVQNPGGKLALSFPTSMDDTWLSGPDGKINPKQYPGTDRGGGFPETDFSEKQLFGYRWFDATGKLPLFAFGHGLSYSSFTLQDLNIQIQEPLPQPQVFACYCCCGYSNHVSDINAFRCL